MQLIPVIDLMQGRAVRAVRGDRQSYRPIVSQLCTGSDPVAVARALCAHCASDTLYVADLDAIVHQRPQADVLCALLQALPGLTLWLDAGFADAASADALSAAAGHDARRIVPVFGSESLHSTQALAACFSPGRPPGILSLDRRGGERLDPAGCWDAPELWPQRVIVMTLERVGADAGPDLQTLGEVQARSPGTQLVGAGGIRDAADLEQAARAGAQAWLVASALHDGRLPPVERVAGRDAARRDMGGIAS
jgi:HisA/HisF family protein